MLTSTSALPASTKLRVWTRKNSTKSRKHLVWVKKVKGNQKSLRLRQAKEKVKIWKARARNIAPPGPPATSRRSARTAGEATGGDAVRDAVPCADAAITRRADCPPSAIC